MVFVTKVSRSSSPTAVVRLVMMMIKSNEADTTLRFLRSPNWFRSKMQHKLHVVISTIGNVPHRIDNFLFSPLYSARDYVRCSSGSGG